MAYHLVIEALGQVESERVEVDDNKGLLVGRRPDATVLDAADMPRSPVLTHPIRLPSVSTNHVLAWSDNGQLNLRDLDSRNGTWVLIPRGGTIRLTDETEVHLRLAFSGGSSNSEHLPEPPRYQTGSDFGAGVAHAVRNWLVHLSVPAQVWAARSEDQKFELDATRFRLASGEHLLVQADRTTSAEFHEQMSRVARYIAHQNALYAAEEETRNDGMILASPSLRSIHRRVVEAALRNVPSVVLIGPSGTGKERLARAFHRRLGRSGPLVAINCATLSKDRVVVDLFGAEKGAYTGAQRKVAGAVERADGGTLFLDEIGEMPSDVQAALLRFLETGEYYRLGAMGEPRFADVRIVAATNRDLRQMVQGGTFREDLFYRLALEIVQVPPLRERFADADAYLQGQSWGSTSVFGALEPEAYKLLQAHSWSGNFRELVNFVRRLQYATDRTCLDADTVQKVLSAGALSTEPVTDMSLAAIPPSSSPHQTASSDDWVKCLTASLQAFEEDAEHEGLSSWSDVTNFVERYFKPMALAHLANLGPHQSLDSLSTSHIAEFVKADRGTVTKQLRRYFDGLV